MRIDKWLWVARFFKTRSLAQEQLEHNRMHVNGQPAKASRELKIGDEVALRTKDITITLTVLGEAPQRGPASTAQTLYSETPASALARAQAAELRQSHWATQTGSAERPSKRDRRERERFTDQQTAPTNDWDERWSAGSG